MPEPPAKTEKLERRHDSPETAEENFYFDGQFLVFTAAYHRKRGFCCGNGCRHCPYDEFGKSVPGKGEVLAS